MQQLVVATFDSDIAADLRVADDVACPIVKCGQAAGGPELGAVLAAAPAFRVAVSVGARPGELVCWRSLRSPLWREQARVGLTEDIVVSIAIHLLRAFLPGHDEACRIHHEDRIVGDAFQKLAQARFGGFQGFFSALA